MEHFDTLPLDLSLHIFSLLPIESVSDCVLVSKSWKNFIHSPSFFMMHANRLVHLVKEADADFKKQVKEADEYCKLARPTLEQAFESIEQIHLLRIHKENLVERINSIGLAEEKRENSLRLAEKCVKIGKEYNTQSETDSIVLGKSSFKVDDKSNKKKEKDVDNDVLELFDEKFNCSFCVQLLDRPVTTPCGHNYCLKCFLKWVGQGKQTCAKCRRPIPSKMASEPRINSAVVIAVRMARMSRSSNVVGPSKVQHFVHNQNKPDKAYTTERAKKTGKANASSVKILVTTAPDYFGPILAENDPVRKQGVLVGESWEDRMECRQWGAHLPHVAGVAGQSGHGAQSVALLGGYEDDEDHGEWFLYTGSGGRESFDQKFVKMNEALRLSCRKGYPVRVVRSHKEKRSSYAPGTGVRYDGVYRIEKCWRKTGIQGFKVCRYLFVRCDNEPAPWTSDEHGDRPRPLPVIKELKQATDITVRTEQPSWHYDEEEGFWKWKKSPPLSRKPMESENPQDRKRARIAIKQEENLAVREKLLKEFSCLICRKVMTLPLTTPCAHNFCKPCLVGAFSGQGFVKQRTCEGRRTLRAQKTVMKCPSCPNDISDFVQNPQVNRELMDVIESLQSKTDANMDDIEENAEIIEENASEEMAEVVLEHTETPKRKAKKLQTAASETETALASKRRKTMDHVSTENGVRTRSMRSMMENAGAVGTRKMGS